MRCYDAIREPLSAQTRHQHGKSAASQTRTQDTHLSLDLALQATMALEWILDTQRALRKWDSRVEHDWRAKWKWGKAKGKGRWRGGDVIREDKVGE